MKTDVSLKSEETLKRIKLYFSKILELNLRRTGSDRRRRIFGRDPLLPEPKVAFK